jgi:YHS domain-containing protein
MLRLILLLILITFIARAFWRLMDGVIAGARGGRSVNPPGGKGAGGVKAVQMARDPVCGTFVVPERAVTLTNRSGVVYFCSDRCRDAYRSGDGASRPDTVRDRTA